MPCFFGVTLTFGKQKKAPVPSLHHLPAPKESTSRHNSPWNVIIMVDTTAWDTDNLITWFIRDTSRHVHSPSQNCTLYFYGLFCARSAATNRELSHNRIFAREVRHTEQEPNLQAVTTFDSSQNNRDTLSSLCFSCMSFWPTFKCRQKVTKRTKCSLFCLCLCWWHAVNTST